MANKNIVASLYIYCIIVPILLLLLLLFFLVLTFVEYLILKYTYVEERKGNGSDQFSGKQGRGNGTKVGGGGKKNNFIADHSHFSGVKIILYIQ